MGQDRKPETGKYKHNDAEHPIWIVDRSTCSLVCFVLQRGPKRYLTPRALAFQVLFGSDCSFTCSFGKGEPALQKDFEILRGLRDSQNAGVFIKIICDIRFRAG